jgi:cyclopropane fatty-acyl-phospholipid synthase-like methyltransferase
MGSRRLIYEMIYGGAKDETKLHWHNEESPILLKKAMESLHDGCNALDIGCGTGVNSVFMAQNGLKVTGIDFIPKALAFARERAKKSQVDVDLVQSDVTEFYNAEKFDLILDNGCLHTFDNRKRVKYKEKLLSLMSDRANYVLLHISKSKPLDFGLGPKGKSKDEIERFFGPELRLVEFLPRAGGMPFHQYRFVRNYAEAA